MALYLSVVSILLMHWRFHIIIISSITTRLLKSQYSDISPDNHCSVICASPSIFRDMDRYNIDNTLQVYDLLNSVDIISFLMDGIYADVVQYGNHFVKPLKLKSVKGGLWHVVWYRKLFALMFNNKVWRTTSDVNSAARRPIRAISGNRAYQVVKDWVYNVLFQYRVRQYRLAACPCVHKCVIFAFRRMTCIVNKAFEFHCLCCLSLFRIALFMIT